MLNKKQKICLVTKDLNGPVKNGGIGTAFYNLAIFLKEQQHEVDILYAGPINDIPKWINKFKELGINLNILSKTTNYINNLPEPVIDSYETYLWLKDKNYNIVHFHEWGGLGYYSLAAKQNGYFSDCLMITQTHSPSYWHLYYNAEISSSYKHSCVDFLERKSVEFSDIVISPSQYMVDWCKKMGWKFPKTQIIPNLCINQQKNSKTKINEVVFFGRLEIRKGLDLFIKAVNKIEENIKISFLGKNSYVNNSDSLTYIKENMNKEYQIIDNLDSQEAIKYLTKNKLAVIASYVENSPYCVVECIKNNIAFISSKTGGIPELTEDDVFFELNPESLKEKIISNITKPIYANSKLSDDNIKSLYKEIHQLSFNQKIKNQNPLVSVCITHYNRPDLLKKTLESIKNQSYKNYEIIITDDGSSEESKKVFKEIDKDIKVIYQKNKYLGAARNTSAKHAKGKFLIFMDDDNYALPNQIEEFVRSQANSKADILTANMKCFTEEMNDNLLFPPLGASINNGIFENCFGDANAFIKKSVFDKLGGFTEDYGVGFEDYEFFAKAALNGFKLHIVTEPLLYYRVDNNSMLHTTNNVKNRYRALRPYLNKYPELSTSLIFSQNLYYSLYHENSPINKVQELECHIKSLECHIKNLESYNLELDQELVKFRSNINQKDIKTISRIRNNKLTKFIFKANLFAYRFIAKLIP